MLWSDLFQCKIPHIDAQHRALFEQVERLGDASLAGARIPETIGFLETYTKEHFADEESLHGQTRYPGAAEHQRQHQNFVAKIKAFRRQYEESGASLPTLMEVNKVVVAWLKEHVLSSDKEFGLFYHALPEEGKRTLRLPLRPWIPESSQNFYKELTMGKPAEEPSPRAVPTSVPRAPGTMGATGGFGDTCAAGNSPKGWESVSACANPLSCGIPDMDEQHRELFLQLDILRDGRDKDQVAKVLWFLSDYLIKHFADEEMLQLRSGYPQTAQHRKIHADFIGAVSDMRKKLEQSKDSRAVALEINRAIYDWLRNHVMTVDKEFGRYFTTREESPQG